MNHCAHCQTYYRHMSYFYDDHYEAAMFFIDKAHYYWGISK